MAYKQFQLRAAVHAYEVQRVEDGRREFVVNGSVIIDADTFHKLFVLDEARAVVVASPAPQPRPQPVPGRAAAHRRKRGRPAKATPPPDTAQPAAAPQPQEPQEPPKPKLEVNYSDLVRLALKRTPMSNQELRQYIAEHGDPDVSSETVSSVVNGLRRRNEVKKRDADLRWELAPKSPDVTGEVLPGSEQAYRDSDI